MSTDTKNKQITIKNVSDFLAEIKKLRVKKGYELIYRGVNDFENAIPEKDRPSIFRESGHIKNEDKMFHELVARKPDDFEKCRNTFEHLVIMQHYKHPTRLLDVTYNPLVALYFACTGKPNTQNGRVIVYRNKVDKICNYNSDRVTCLANLSNSSFEISIVEFFLNSIAYSYKYFLDNVKKFASSYKSKTNKLKDKALEEIKYTYFNEHYKYYNDLIFSKGDSGFYYIIHGNKALCEEKSYIKSHIDYFFAVKEDFSKKYSEFQLTKNLEDENYFLYDLPRFIDGTINSFSYGLNDKNFIRYRHNIINEKPAFDPNMIECKDISSVFFVQPKQNNSRIIAQNGAFLIFGLHKEANDKSKNPLIPNATSTEKAPVQRLSTQLIIPKKNKKAILKELATLNITKASLFPEIENVADVIKEKYKK